MGLNPGYLLKFFLLYTYPAITWLQTKCQNPKFIFYHFRTKHTQTAYSGWVLCVKAKRFHQWQGRGSIFAAMPNFCYMLLSRQAAVYGASIMGVQMSKKICQKYILMSKLSLHALLGKWQLEYLFWGNFSAKLKTVVNIPFSRSKDDYFAETIFQFTT